jgi:DNA-binding NarL/FixJ family response regulator
MQTGSGIIGLLSSRWNRYRSLRKNSWQISETPILILTMENNPLVMEKCKNAGAMAFLPKSIDKDQLLKAISAAVSGITTFPALEKKANQKNPELKKLEILSKREKEIAHWIAIGYSSSQVSEKLF